MTQPILNRKFKPLFTNDTRYFVITGGRGSAKSFHVSDAVLKYTYEAGHKILYTRKTMTSAHISVIPEFKEKIDLYESNSNFAVTKAEITNLLTGSEILFRGLQTSSGDQTAKLKSIQGITAWILDEAEEETDEAEFDKIDFSLRTKGKQTRIIIILNPATRAHWIYKRFFESKGVQEGFNGVKGNTTYIHSTYLDNIKNLDHSFIDRAIELMETNPDKYNHIMLGGWVEKADGVIFRNWKYGDFDNSLPFYYGLDYGFKPDPDAMGKVAIDMKRKIIYYKTMFRSNELTATEIVDKVKAIAGTRPVHSDSAEQRINEMMRRAGVNIFPTKKYPNSVVDGIRMVQDYELIVDPESITMGNELNNYVEKNGQPLSNGMDHEIDELRYVVMGVTQKPNYITPKLGMPNDSRY